MAHRPHPWLPGCTFRCGAPAGVGAVCASRALPPDSACARRAPRHSPTGEEDGGAGPPGPREGGPLLALRRVDEHPLLLLQRDAQHPRQHVRDVRPPGAEKAAGGRAAHAATAQARPTQPHACLSLSPRSPPSLLGLQQSALVRIAGATPSRAPAPTPSPARHRPPPQDFEALTPNLLARTIETVEGGGIVVLLLSHLNSLTTLYSMAMDVHARYRTESHQEVTQPQSLSLFPSGNHGMRRSRPAKPVR